ncbi:MAG: DnaB-like helicase C-terminal domain-containing protein [Kofleriaceae bacterium]
MARIKASAALPRHITVVDGNEPTNLPETRDAETVDALLVANVAAMETPPIRSYSTGNLALDNLTAGGVNTREVTIVLGPPGGCKTGYAISTAITLHDRHSLPQLYACTELEQHELMARVAANVLGKPWGGIRRGTIDKQTIISALEDRSIYLLGSDKLPREGDAAIALIEKTARQIFERVGAMPGITVDYLQDFARGDSKELRSRVGDLATMLRRMSQDLDTTMIVVSSVARSYYSPHVAKKLRELDEATAYLAAAKESGDVDYAAARVLFLDAEDDRDNPERGIRIAVAKSRDGRTGFAGARVVLESGRFMPDTGIVSQMSGVGRSTEQAADGDGDADEKALLRLRKEWDEGRGELCTETYVRSLKGLGTDKWRACLGRLRLSGRVVAEPRDRLENGKPKTRTVLRPEGAS